MVNQRKHKNSKQEEIILKYMREHQDVARGFSKGDKVTQDKLWSKLETSLNASGPPRKEKGEWKKTWNDWKRNVKNKLSHNKVENGVTGGGRFNKYVLTAIEEEIATICGLYKAVDGIKNARSYGVPTANKENVEEHSISASSSSASTSYKSPKQSTHHYSPERSPEATVEKKRKIDDTLLNKLMEKEASGIEAISEAMKKMSDSREGFVNELKIVHVKLDSLNQKYDAIVELKKQKLDEIKKDRQERKRHNKAVEEHHKAVEKHNYEILKREVRKIELKLELIDLEQEKLKALSTTQT